MCILHLSKVLMCTNSIMITLKINMTTTQDYYSQTLIKTEDVYEGFSSDKEMSDFSNYSTKSKYYDEKISHWQNER